MEVEWQPLNLATPGPYGYALTSGPVGERIAGEVKRLAAGRMPALVWIRDPENDRANAVVEGNLADENLRIALERFLCLRADVNTLPDPKMREKLRRQTPVLLLFDAAGAPFNSLEGRRAGSRAALWSRVEKLWNRTFTLPLRVYSKRKDGILDLKDRIERRKATLLTDLIRAEGKPAKRAALKKDVEKIEGLMLEVLESEKRLRASVKLREKYLARPAGKQSG